MNDDPVINVVNFEYTFYCSRSFGDVFDPILKSCVGALVDEKKKVDELQQVVYEDCCYMQSGYAFFATANDINIEKLRKFIIAGVAFQALYNQCENTHNAYESRLGSVVNKINEINRHFGVTLSLPQTLFAPTEIKQTANHWLDEQPTQTKNKKKDKESIVKIGQKRNYNYLDDGLSMLRFN